MPSTNSRLKRFSTKEKFIILAVILAVAVLLASEFLVIPQIFHKSPQVVKPVIGPIQPAAGYCLPYRGNISRIFVVSTTISSGSYPYPTRSALGQSGGPPVVKEGEPCVVINVAIRNDYSAQYPPPIPIPASPGVAYVFLTAEVLNGSNEINATDLTHVGLPPNSWAFVSLNSGETKILSIYLATTSKSEITSFEVVPVSISGFPPP